MTCCRDSVMSSSYGGDTGTMQNGGDYQSQQMDFLSSNKLCFKCATFWIIIVALAFFVLAGSRR